MARRGFPELARALARDLPPELPPELRRLAGELRAPEPEHPLVGGVALALGVRDGTRGLAAPLLRLAAEMLADHAESAAWTADDLYEFLDGIGPERAADFLERIAGGWNGWKRPS